VNHRIFLNQTFFPKQINLLLDNGNAKKIGLYFR